MFATFAEAMKSGLTLTFGHRGARAYAPMNTLPSFEMAAAMGAHGIEFDVRRSRDGELVLLHDPTIDGTSNGQGAVSDKTFPELRELDFGGWFHADYAGTIIPTLDEVFEAFGARFLMNVEIKSEHLSGGGIEAQVAEAITRHGLEQRVLVSSFNPLTVWRFGRLMPHVLRGLLVEGETPFGRERLLRTLDVQALHPYYPFIDDAYMRNARTLGLAVNTWTVNEPADAVRLRDLGVCAVITDRPDTILAAIDA